mgnify:CR=1 FL=1
MEPSSAVRVTRPSVKVRLDWRSGVNFTVTRMRMEESLLAAADARGGQAGRSELPHS